MRCTRPRTVGFKADGKTLAWSQKERSKEYAPFQLECRKCIECRLQYGREWGIRCLHEAQMHSQNCFITLTYSDEHLKDPKLDYGDFQAFIKRLRHASDEPLSYIACGEYGEVTKRPHWHAIVFNWYPKDATYLRSTQKGHKVYESEILNAKWQKGKAELGSVTLESASYVARYSAKKLAHGEEVEDFQPIFKVSSKRAIGKAWLEKFHDDIFNYGRLTLADGSQSSIPRYYTKWLKENEPEKWLRYIQGAKEKMVEHATARSRKEEEELNKLRRARGFRGYSLKSKNQIREELSKIRHEQLLSHLKLK